MRIQLYGVQGSGSVFPRFREREAAWEVSDFQLLDQVFSDLTRRSGPDGRLNCRVEDIIGGPLDRSTLLAYRDAIRPEQPISYGGWTTCVQVEIEGGVDLVFDCGSGFRNCAHDLQSKWADRPKREVHIFGSHSHRDHTEGFDQAPVCFDSRNRIHVYGNHQFLHALDEHLGIFSRKSRGGARQVHTPVTYQLMPARFSCHLIGQKRNPNPKPKRPLAAVAETSHAVGEPISIGNARITPFKLFHPAPCLGYRIESGGSTFVYATDHELRRAPAGDRPKRQAKSEAAEASLEKYAAGADLLYRDGQYLRSEYDGEKGIGDAQPVSRLDWGHSCIEDVTDMARRCEVKHTLIGHHDPNREWAERQWIDESLSRSAAAEGRIVELAKAETVIDL